MIGALRGKLTHIDGNTALIETSGGVFYRTYLTSSFLSRHRESSDVFVLTYLQVKDDGLVLFGFENKEDLRIFKLLLSVSGVGPKTAFSVVSHSNSRDLLHAVSENNLSYFTNIPGLGKKTAMKIILELSQKIKSEFQLEKFSLNEEDTTVIQALVALGYSSADANSLFGKIPHELSIEDKIKYALRLSSQKNGQNKTK